MLQDGGDCNAVIGRGSPSGMTWPVCAGGERSRKLRYAGRRYNSLTWAECTVVNVGAVLPVSLVDLAVRKLCRGHYFGCWFWGSSIYRPFALKIGYILTGLMDCFQVERKWISIPGEGRAYRSRTCGEAAERRRTGEQHRKRCSVMEGCRRAECEWDDVDHTHTHTRTQIPHLTQAGRKDGVGDYTGSAGTESLRSLDLDCGDCSLAGRGRYATRTVGGESSEWDMRVMIGFGRAVQGQQTDRRGDTVELKGRVWLWICNLVHKVSKLG